MGCRSVPGGSFFCEWGQMVVCVCDSMILVNIFHGTSPPPSVVVGDHVVIPHTATSTGTGIGTGTVPYTMTGRRFGNKATVEFILLLLFYILAL